MFLTGNSIEFQNEFYYDQALLSKIIRQNNQNCREPITYQYPPTQIEWKFFEQDEKVLPISFELSYF